VIAAMGNFTVLQFTPPAIIAFGDDEPWAILISTVRN
jgi:hypothetical protein